MRDGFLNLNKPTRISSRAAVDLAARAVGRGVRIGHAGTLDPLASGVLVVGIGRGLRLIEHVQRQTKVYRAVVRLGARSDTLDADGVVEPAEVCVEPSLEQVQAAAAAQVGQVLQTPPQVSALKVKGRRAYDLARRGEDVPLAPRLVSIKSIRVLSYQWPDLGLEVECGAGTYIRSIARDVGETLGCGGYIQSLVRTRIGPFSLDAAVDPVSLDAEAVPGVVRPLLDAVVDLPRVTLTAEQVALIRHGQALDARRLETAAPSGEVVLLAPDGALAAIGNHDEQAGVVRPRKVLVQSDGS